MILPRILTAVCLIPLVLVCVWYGSLPYFVFILGVCLLCTWEFSVMADEGGYPNQLVLSMLGTLLILSALFFDGVPRGPMRFVPTVFFVFVGWSFLVFFRELIRGDKRYSMLFMITTLFAVTVCGLFLGHLLLIRDLKIVAGEGMRPIGRELVFFLLFTIWSLDSAAWATGMMFGRHKMAPRISPKKTWEGALGGTAAAILVGWLCREIFLKDGLGRIEVIVLSIVIAITAQVSDLIESLMKRSFGVKDSSKILPGHGGILDRFDSLIFSAPILYYLLVATGRFR